MESKTKIIYSRFKEQLIGTWSNDEGHELIFKNSKELRLDWKIKGQVKIENQFMSADSDGTNYYFFIDKLRMFVYEDFENDKIKIEFKDSLGNIKPEKTLNLKKVR